MALQHSIALFFFFSSLIVLTDLCKSNSRCLANNIVAKKMKSAPQGKDCSVTVNITSMLYETLSFDTKNMQMSSAVKVNMLWTDPDLAWSNEESNATEIIVPVDKIWTPGIVLDNAIDVTMKPYTDDVVVSKDGTVDHAVILVIAVSCDINLFTYPFVRGDCPVAINGWSLNKCKLEFHYPSNISIKGNNQSGEWITENVTLTKDKEGENRNFISVTLSINPFSAVVTLLLPSALIMLADLVSFSLPVQGGERNSLKVTLVLSFTMFLLILNDHLASGGRCSPLVHYHFCFCLVNLVLSMIMSITLTRLTIADSILSCKCSKSDKTRNARTDQDEDAGVMATTRYSDSASEKVSLQKIVNFLENVDQKEQVTNSNEVFVDRLDKVCFFFFFFIDIIYIVIVFIVANATDLCKGEKMNIWDAESSFSLLGDPIFFYNNTEYEFGVYEDYETQY